MHKYMCNELDYIHIFTVSTNPLYIISFIALQFILRNFWVKVFDLSRYIIFISHFFYLFFIYVFLLLS